MYRIGVYSKDAAIIEILQRMMEKKRLAKIYIYHSDRELWNDIISDSIQTDMMIISIGGQDENIIEISRILQEKNKDVSTIFLLEDPAYVSDVFDLGPAYLLMKPVDGKKLYLAILKVIRKITEKRTDMLELCYKNRIIRIPYGEILYIESDRRYLDIYFSGKSERVLMKMDAISKKLPDYFVRCHQSYIVNIKKVAGWEKNMLYVGEDIHIPISRNRLQATKAYIDRYYL